MDDLLLGISPRYLSDDKIEHLINNYGFDWFSELGYDVLKYRHPTYEIDKKRWMLHKRETTKKDILNIQSRIDELEKIKAEKLKSLEE